MCIRDRCSGPSSPASGPRCPTVGTGSSSTWSPASTSSSTRDDDGAAGPGPGHGPGSSLTQALDPDRSTAGSAAALPGPAAGVVRLVHPFPSILDGLVVGLVALVGGGGPGTAAVLGLSMTLLQFAIGALNDIVDARRDAGRTPPKPIPAGRVEP